MELNDIAEDEVKRWCDWRNWLAVECRKHLPQYELWYQWSHKLYREERWPWWQRMWMYISGKQPQLPYTCGCVLTAFDYSFTAGQYLDDVICPLHAQQFQLRQRYSESTVFWLVQTSRKLGCTFRRYGGEDGN